MRSFIPTTPLMADYLALFLDNRLTPSEPHHLEFIKGRLAAMKVEDPASYEKYSSFYGVDLSVEVTKEPAKAKKQIKKLTSAESKALGIKKTK